MNERDGIGKLTTLFNHDRTMEEVVILRGFGGGLVVNHY